MIRMFLFVSVFDILSNPNIMPMININKKVRD
jgi:hypothetical protein